MDQERYIEANRTAQILLVILAAIGIIGFALGQSLFGIAVPGEGAVSAVLNSFVQSVRVGNWILLAVSILFSAAWSYYLARMGIKGLAYGEFPPPGTLVAFRTKVKTGVAARISSWMALTLAVVFWFPVIMLVYSLFLIDKYTY